MSYTTLILSKEGYIWSCKLIPPVGLSKKGDKYFAVEPEGVMVILDS